MNSFLIELLELFCRAGFSMKNEVIDILILGLLVVLFASIYRKRATARLRYWVIAWILVLLHFGALLAAVSPRTQEVVDSLSMSTLLLSGLCFLFSAWARHPTSRVRHQARSRAFA